MPEVKISAGEMLGAIKRSIERLPHSAKFARKTELDIDALYLNAAHKAIQWMEDNRKLMISLIAAHKEKQP